MQTSITGADSAPSVESAKAATTARANAEMAKINAELLAGLGELHKDDAKPPGAPADEVKPVVEVSAEVKPAEVSAAPPDEVKPLEEVPLDDAAKKRIAAEQTRERKRTEQLAKERGEFDAAKKKLEDEWRPRVEKAEAFEALVGGGVPAAMKALEQLKLTPEEYAALAPAAWALSPKGKEDPKARAAAAKTLQDHSVEARFAAQAKEIAELKSQITAEKTAAKHAADVDAYLGTVEKALKDPTPEEAAAGRKPVEAPLLKRIKPDAARALFNRVALDLLDEHGTVPTAAEVIAAAEARERADLIARGYDPDAIVAPKAAAKPAPGKPSPTLGNGGAGAPAVVQKPLTGRALEQDIARGLRELRESGSV